MTVQPVGSQQSSVETVEALRAALCGVILGKSEAIDLLLVGVLARGHVLLEDVPGVGKTTLAKALAHCFDVDFARVQFTPDLLPTDIIGSVVLQPSDGSFAFRPGPLFAHVVLADEINRASPRTQSALLEAMNEEQVTVDGTTHALPTPFFVLATQNPVDFQGTYPLPEAQLDRFLLRLELGYPDLESELEILFSQQGSHPLAEVNAIATAADWQALVEQVRQVEVKQDVARYLLRIVEETRRHREIELGISTRGSLALFRAAQGRSFLQQRNFVTPEDVQVLLEPVLAHRLVLSTEAKYGGKDGAALLAEIIPKVEIPL